jgi:hypothetical protein
MEEVYIGLKSYLKIPAKTGNVYFNNHKQTKKYFTQTQLILSPDINLRSMIVIREPIKRWFSAYIFCMRHRYAGLSYVRIDPDFIHKFIDMQYEAWRDNIRKWYRNDHFVPIWNKKIKENHWDIITDTENLTETLQKSFPIITWNPHTINDNKAIIKYNVEDYKELICDSAYNQLQEIYAEDIEYYDKYCKAKKHNPQGFICSKDLE